MCVRTITWIFGKVVRLDHTQVVFVGHGHRSEFKVTGGNVAKWAMRPRRTAFLLRDAFVADD